MTDKTSISPEQELRFANKLVAVMNKSLEPGVALNALAHLSLSMGASLGTEAAHLIDYQDQSGEIHPRISKLPVIILRATSNKIATLRQIALEQGLTFVDFTHTMTEGTWEEQVARTRQTLPSDLTYYGIMLHGKWETITALTRKFSLWR